MSSEYRVSPFLAVARSRRLAHPITADDAELRADLLHLVEVEGPITAGGLIRRYLELAAIRDDEHDASSRRLLDTRTKLEVDGRLESAREAVGGSKNNTYWIAGQSPARLRTLGPRKWTEIPLSELTLAWEAAEATTQRRAQRAAEIPDVAHILEFGQTPTSEGTCKRILDARLDAQLASTVPSEERRAATMLDPERYERVGRIGAGQFGMVFQFRDLQLDRDVACKFLSSGHDDAYIAEARKLARVRHANVLEIYDVGMHVSDGVQTPYIEMEHAAGGSALDLFTTDDPVDVDAALDLLQRVGEGLLAMHAERLVHRDIKPANILRYTPDGSDWVIADVGIAADLAATLDAAPAGTPRYMAPEQYLGSVSSPSVDTYGLASTVYHLLTGQPTHADERDARTTMLRKAATAPAPIRTLRPDVPLAVASLLDRALAPIAEERLRDLAQLLDLLARARAPRIADVAVRFDIAEPLTSLSADEAWNDYLDDPAFDDWRLVGSEVAHDDRFSDVAGTFDAPDTGDAVSAMSA